MIPCGFDLLFTVASVSLSDTDECTDTGRVWQGHDTSHDTSYPLQRGVSIGLPLSRFLQVRMNVRTQILRQFFILLDS